MTERPLTPQQKRQETIARNREAQRREDEAAALERIREECRRRKRLQRKELRRVSKDGLLCVEQGEQAK
jgi:hypothetical protein